ncbi:formylglycine-generating enzyme family protein [Bernardetia sp. OM2101]|uniref:formylglycine-generating enzyme family protein n=1 Tax=Bernardetia sp. OM2101 TaxID=3344876 RepID=UPI0035D08AEB
MKNIFFVVFLFLPFLSYSQVALSSFEENAQDSSLTISYKLSHYKVQADTIYPKEIPKKLVVAFDDVDSVATPFHIIITLARGYRPIISNTYSASKKVNFPTSKIRWDGDRLIVFAKFYRNNTLDSLVNEIYIVPQPITDKINRLEKERIQDSTKRAESLRRIKENHPLAVEYYQKRFDKLKEPQENLTEKDKKKITKIYSKSAPPNGVWVDTNKYFDETEIANIHWLEYMHYMLQDSSDSHYNQAKPDSMIWYKNLDKVDAYLFHYLRYPGFRYFPVNGISYMQAQQYCVWRGNIVTKRMNEKLKLVDSDYEITVHYRLPTKEEWEYAAIKDDLNKQFGGYSTKRRYTEKEKRKIYRLAKRYSDSTRTIEHVKLDMKNYFESDTSYKRMFTYKPTYQNPYFDTNIFLYEGQLITTWIYSNQPVYHFGLYNMFGNVAEMTSEKGIAKGGSFAHTLEECAADKVQTYDSPQAWLGFRCVAEVVVRKKEEVE